MSDPPLYQVEESPSLSLTPKTEEHDISQNVEDIRQQIFKYLAEIRELNKNDTIFFNQGSCVDIKKIIAAAVKPGDTPKFICDDLVKSFAGYDSCAKLIRPKTYINYSGRYRIVVYTDWSVDELLALNIAHIYATWDKPGSMKNRLVMSDDDYGYIVCTPNMYICYEETKEASARTYDLYDEMLKIKNQYKKLNL